MRQLNAGMRDDEKYALRLCDYLLGKRHRPQYRFDFLRGDSASAGRKGAMLPVDAYYPSLALVIEYRESQHSEYNALFDDKPTVSGVTRGLQRRRYDQRRRRLLPRHGIKLVELDCTDFLCDRDKRLRRNREADLAVIRKKLRRHGFKLKL